MKNPALYPGCRLRITVFVSCTTVFTCHQVLAQVSVQHGISVTNQASVRKISVRAVSPIAYFRELLAMKPDERDRALGDKTLEQRQIILSKLREYKGMSPEERELRLKITEVRWYLAPLMKLSPVERLKSLAAIPAADRELIERRLKIWDEIPPQLQKEFLNNEAVISHILRTPEEREASIYQFSPDKCQKLQQELAQWTQLPADKRQQMCDRFNQFFALDEDEKKKTLGTLSLVERQQMEKTLQSFESLPPQRRAKCIESFGKFTQMRPEEREQFLKNAERWQSMTPSERLAWREIVQKGPATPPPPLPPGMRLTPPAPPKFIVSTNLASPSTNLASASTNLVK